ncbi:hypothetical protein T484DRAFT_1757328 [Baffinella frigidus]|nr:hypothetical protein T484DRAFT_1757328 [Cryptophyta sp. CCMP2293]
MNRGNSYSRNTTKPTVLCGMDMVSKQTSACMDNCATKDVDEIAAEHKARMAKNNIARRARRCRANAKESAETRAARLLKESAQKRDRIANLSVEKNAARLAAKKVWHSAFYERETVDARVVRAATMKANKIKRLALETKDDRANRFTKQNVQSRGQREKRNNQCGRSRAVTQEFFKTHGIKTTAFGIGDLTRDEEIIAIVERVMNNKAGFENICGEATQQKWLSEQGSMSLKDRLLQGDMAVYVHVTMQSITAGIEEECSETADFMLRPMRNPIWRISDGVDLRRFTMAEFNSIRRSYILATCISNYDVTGLETECQRYLKDVLGMPHGMCLHRKVGAGSRLENSFSPAEMKRIENGEHPTYSLAITVVKTNGCIFADADPSYPERPPSLLQTNAVSHDNTNTFNIVVASDMQFFPDQQRFPDTPSVLADACWNETRRVGNKERHRKRKAADISAEDDSDEFEEL